MKSIVTKNDLALGAYLKKCRRLAGLSQPKLGEMMKFSYQHLSQVERGKARASVDVLKGYAKHADADKTKMMMMLVEGVREEITKELENDK